ncbi:MAG: hypothetical protein RIR23_360, partial [Pseudomonadota bacterium]
DTKKAVNFLKTSVGNGFNDGWYTVEEIACAIDNNCGTPALARNLRRKTIALKDSQQDLLLIN